jgi:hypothetical protein
MAAGSGQSGRRNGQGNYCTPITPLLRENRKQPCNSLKNNGRISTRLSFVFNVGAIFQTVGCEVDSRLPLHSISGLAASREARIQRHPPIDVYTRAGDIVRLIGSQKDSNPANVLGLAYALIGNER